MDEDLCPDCNHKVSVHDQWGCTLYRCKRRCPLTGEFLLEFFKENNEPS